MVQGSPMKENLSFLPIQDLLAETLQTRLTKEQLNKRKTSKKSISACIAHIHGAVSDE